MRVVIDPKCDFDDKMLQEKGEQIGDMLKPVYDAEDWYHFCKTWFDSGFVEGVENLSTYLVENVKNWDDLQNTRAIDRLCCLQRGMTPLFFAFQKWSLDNVGNYILDRATAQKFCKGELIESMMADLTVFCSWLTYHGASGEFLRKTSKKVLREVERIERTKGGTYMLISHGYTACCIYRALKDKVFMPELEKKLAAIREAQERARKERERERAERAIAAQTERLYGATSRFISALSEDTQTEYQDTGFRSGIKWSR